MVEIIVYRRENDVIGFCAQGHAGYAEKGYDICCAGVSAVTQTALLGLLMHLDPVPSYSIGEGRLECRLKAGTSAAELEKAQIILSTMEAGLIRLQDAYPQYVKVRIERC